LRIAVNEELDALQEGLAAAIDLLRPGGRLVVLSYHSLEDRIVKRFIATERRGCVCPPELPVCVCGRNPRLRPLTRRSVTPTAAEVEANPRARSARLRAAERLAA
jgi:16S rRNA (cytosine1402-N4)-methyltransferase